MMLNIYEHALSLFNGLKLKQNRAMNLINPHWIIVNDVMSQFGSMNLIKGM